MGSELNYGLILFLIIGGGWYLFVMYYALKSWLSVFCYTVIPVLGIFVSFFLFAHAGIQHIFPPLFLLIPLIGAGIGVYVGYTLDEKFG